jgi:hypothetical protein
MSIANPLWEAPAFHGDLLELGIDVGRTTAAKFVAKATVASLEDLPSRSCRQWQVLDMRYEFVSIHIGRFLASHRIRRWGRQCADEIFELLTGWQSHGPPGPKSLIKSPSTVRA